MSNLPATGESEALLRAYMQVQPRAKAAFSACQMPRVSSSIWASTPGGLIVPIQLLAISSAAAALGLLIERVSSASALSPPPKEFTHSIASQVSPSQAAPCQRKPRKSGFPASCGAQRGFENHRDVGAAV